MYDEVNLSLHQKLLNMNEAASCLIVPSRKLYVPDSANDISCASLPLDFSLNRSINAKLHAWSNHPFITDDGNTFTVSVCWTFLYDKRGILRATRKNGWTRGEGIECNHPNGRKLIVDRLKRSLKYETLKGKYIARSRFAFACLFPSISLYKYELHHIRPNLLYPKAIKPITAATDDRINNLIRLTHRQHRITHWLMGDGNFFHYQPGINDKDLKESFPGEIELLKKLVGDSTYEI